MAINDGKDWTNITISTTIPKWLHLECKRLRLPLNQAFMRGYQHFINMPRMQERLDALEKGNDRLQGYITAMNENYTEEIEKLDKKITALKNPTKKTSKK